MPALQCESYRNYYLSQDLHHPIPGLEIACTLSKLTPEAHHGASRLLAEFDTELARRVRWLSWKVREMQKKGKTTENFRLYRAENPLLTFKDKGLLKSCQGEPGGWQLALLQVAQILCAARGHEVQCAQQRATNHGKVPCRLLSTHLQEFTTTFLGAAGR